MEATVSQKSKQHAGPAGVVKVGKKWYARWTCTHGHEHRKLGESHKEARGTYHVKRRDVDAAKRRGEPCCPHLTTKTTAPTVAEILDDFLVYSKATKRPTSTTQPGRTGCGTASVLG